MYYLKYRPKDFSKLFGLEDVAAALKNALKKNQVAHAYIFTGPKGSGKTTTARILAKTLNCENPKGEEPCNECGHCRAVNEGRFLDLIEIDGASHRGIDDIRQLREKIKLAPTAGKAKVYIIDEVHMLTAEAFNALLKTLEEPPAHAYFILATTELQKIPETIKSRCQILHFKRGKKEDLAKKLELICREEGVQVSPSDIEKIISLSEGGFRNAETLLEQVVVGGLDLSRADFSVADFTENLVGNDRRGALEYLNRIFEDGENLSVFSQRLILYLRSLLLILGGVGAEVLAVDEESYKRMSRQAQSLGRERLIFALTKFLAAADLGRFAPIPSLPLELAVFDICAETGAVPSDRAESKEIPADLLEPSGGKIKKEEIPESKKSAPQQEGDLTLEEITAKWESVLKEIRPFNHSLEALLRSARPKETEGGKNLVVEVFYKFHKDRLSEPRNREIVEKVFDSVFGPGAKVSFILGEKKVPLRETEPERGNEDIVTAALEAFGS